MLDKSFFQRADTPKSSFALFMQRSDASASVLELYIYDDIYAGREWISWYESKEHEAGAAYIRKQIEAHPECEAIHVYINSAGGDPFEAYAIAALLRRSGKKTTAYVDGMAASAASLILCSCDARVMYANAVVMIHNMSMVTCGNAAQLRQCADALDKMMSGNRQIYLRCMGEHWTEQQLIEAMDAETWLTAAECLELGIATEVSDLLADQTAMEQTAQHTAQRLQRFAAQYRAAAEAVQDAAAMLLAPPPAPTPAPEPEPSPLQKVFGNLIPST